MGELLLIVFVILAGVIIVPLLSKKIVQMEGRSPEEVKSAGEEARKGMVKTLKRFANWAIVIVILGIISVVSLFFYCHLFIYCLES